jgi:hypothetical protein
MQVASMIADVHDDVPRTPVHGWADAEEIEGDQVKVEAMRKMGPSRLRKNSVPDDNK